MGHGMRTIGFVTVADTGESRAIERALKQEAGALDMLATCTSVTGGTRWYRLDGPAFVDPSRVSVLVERMRERERSASIARWDPPRCNLCGDESNSTRGLPCGRVDKPGAEPCRGTYR